MVPVATEPMPGASISTWARAGTAPWGTVTVTCCSASG